MTDPRFRIQFDPPTPETMLVAQEELRETPEIKAEGLRKLRELVENDNSLNFRTDDEVLMIFLRPCKFYPESAYQLMKSVADFKIKYADCISNLLPDDEKVAILEHRVVNVLANRDQNGRRVLIVNLGGLWDTKVISGDSIFKLLYLVHILAMKEPETQIRGCVVILDFEGLGMKQVVQLTPGFSLRLLSFIQDAMPVRMKEVHIVKQPFIFNIVWKVFQPFIREKLKSRLFFHGTKMESLHKHMSVDCLPSNYGGKNPKIDYSSKEWYPTIKENEGCIKEWNSWGRK